MNVIEKAIGFAVKAHAGALRKGTNLPYILHPLEAAAIAAQMTDDQETASRAVKTVVFADKLSNLRSMVTDYIAEGESFWDRFEMKDPHKHVWYYGAMIESFEELGDSLLHREYLRLYRMLRMQVQEYDDFGRHNKNALEVIAPPNNGYWVLRMKKSDDMMLMTEEEFQEFIRNHSGE